MVLSATRKGPVLFLRPEKWSGVPFFHNGMEDDTIHTITAIMDQPPQSGLPKGTTDIYINQSVMTDESSVNCRSMAETAMDSFWQELKSKKYELIGCLECLSILKERIDSQSEIQRTEYREKLMTANTFSADEINNTLDLLRFSDGILKTKTYDWMMSYTDNTESALSLTAFAVSNVSFLRRQISYQHFHKDNVGKGKPGFKKSYEQFFHGTPYQHLVDMVWACHQVITQSQKKGAEDSNKRGIIDNETKTASKKANFSKLIEESHVVNEDHPNTEMTGDDPEQAHACASTLVAYSHKRTYVRSPVTMKSVFDNDATYPLKQTNGTGTAIEEQHKTDCIISEHDFKEWKKYINFQQSKRRVMREKIPDVPVIQEGTNEGTNGKFALVPNCHHMEFMLPPTSEAIQNDGAMQEFLKILEQLPDSIADHLPIHHLQKIFRSHCQKVINEENRSLVIIDGGRYEFYIPHSEDQICSSLFYSEVISPYLSKWNTPKKNRYIKNGKDFVQMLYKYISRCFPPDYKIHAVSFLLDYPNTSEVRQWSHIDGDDTHFQGSVLCGNNLSLTLEFPVLAPKVKTVTDLKQVWDFLPEQSTIFSKMERNEECITYLKRYGTLLNHMADSPLNQESRSKRPAKSNVSSTEEGRNIYMPGTVIRMPGNTIHAGPGSDKSKCRSIFFYAASPQGASMYDPQTQWNAVTLTSAILVELWGIIQPIDRAVLLEYIRRIQSNHKVGPSDTSMFITNYTIRLFVRISMFLKKNPQRDPNYIRFLQALCRIDNVCFDHNTQYITKKMLMDLDADLNRSLFAHDPPGTAWDLFKLK